jgi:myo-inositol-1(or 4)-monophosphatase
MADNATRSPSTARSTRPLLREEKAWLDCAADMAAAGRKAVAPLYGTAFGRTVLGPGAGGDRTLEVDRACETAMREVLERKAPAPFLLVSEEAGTVGELDSPWRVVMDPLDGSHNAKRGLEPFAGSIAVAKGTTISDVQIAYVQDYARSHVFSAVKGAGLLEPPVSADRYVRRYVELVMIEAGRPDRHHFRYHDLSAVGAVGRSRDLRVRQIGSLALALCYVAVGVADVLLAAVRSRSVDIAAGLRILAESGGGAATLSGEDLWAQPLDLEKRHPFLAWRAGLDGAEILARTADLRRMLSSSYWSY